MQLVPDLSLLAQVLIFVVVWACLKRLVFDPTLEILEARRQRTAGAREEAARLATGADSNRDQYEQTRQEARREIALETDAARKTAREEQAELLNKTRDAAAREMLDFRAELQTQRERAREQLAPEVETIAAAMLEQATSGSRT